MTIELSNISAERIGELVVNAVNEANNLNIQIDPGQLSMVRVAGKYILVKDIGDNAGVLMSKIDIKTLFPKLIDLRPFKSRTHIPQIPRSDTPEAVEQLRNASKHKDGSFLVGTGHNVLANPTPHESPCLRDFILFCRVTGFWELDSIDVSLGYSNDKLLLTVVESHPVYIGSIEVLV